MCAFESDLLHLSAHRLESRIGARNLGAAVKTVEQGADPDFWTVSLRDHASRRTI